MPSDQLDLVERSVEQRALEQSTTAADETRRAEYTERLRAALSDLRQIGGFPIATDEDILALSDPPSYTACPNPFLGEFIAEHGKPYDEATDDYHREPFAADVSEGKNDSIYNAHSYHTKVPHKAIMRYVLHFTKPGDIVFDGFCGTGMTGVAAQACGSPDPAFRHIVESEWDASGHAAPEWGVRSAILCDLSPAATFIAYNYNTPIDPATYRRVAKEIIGAAQAEVGPLYSESGAGEGPSFNYAVWTELMQCPQCGESFRYLEAVLDRETLQLASSFHCPGCAAELTKGTSTPLRRSISLFGEIVHENATELAELVSQTGTRRAAGALDKALADSVSIPPADLWVPQSRLPHGRQTRKILTGAGIAFVVQLFTPRNLKTVAWLWARIKQVGRARVRARLAFALTASMGSASKRERYRDGSGKGIQTGTLYVPSVQIEKIPHRLFSNKVAHIADLPQPPGACAISTQSAADLTQVPDQSVDYVFVDPPFGESLQYAELNFLAEAWLRVTTAMPEDAVINYVHNKDLAFYAGLMRRCFEQHYRVLKPGRWITVVFHNSSNAVWNAIQEAIQRSGLVVADVRGLDKQQGTYNSVNRSGAVKQDLVISAYKPRAGFERRFTLAAGTEEGAWDFVREHLEQLPVFVERAGQVEVVAERQNYLLFDRMVAFHIQHGTSVPLAAGQFYAALHQRFPERDDMYFTPLQAAVYDKRRLEVKGVEQLTVIVIDERSAIQWIRTELAAKPQTFQDLQPKFLRELNQNRFEVLPELREILEQNFLEDPSTHRWRVPDPGKQADLVALRLRALLNEFATYLPGTAKLKRFRLEAIRAGFSDLWAKRDYRAIIKLAERLPDEVVQEDPAILMYYDNAVTREGGA